MNCHPNSTSNPNTNRNHDSRREPGEEADASPANDNQSTTSSTDDYVRELLDPNDRPRNVWHVVEGPKVESSGEGECNEPDNNSQTSPIPSPPPPPPPPPPEEEQEAPQTGSIAEDEGNVHVAEDPQDEKSPLGVVGDLASEKGQTGEESSSRHHRSHDEHQGDHREHREHRDRHRDRDREKERNSDRNRSRDRDRERDRHRRDRRRDDRDDYRSSRRRRDYSDDDHDHDDNGSSRHHRRSHRRHGSRSSHRRDRSGSRTSSSRRRGRSRSNSHSPLTKRNSRTILIMQLNSRVTSHDLEEFFADIGKVKEVRLITDSKTRKHKGIAYIEFEDAGSAAKAFALNGQEFFGAPINIQTAHSDRIRSSGDWHLSSSSHTNSTVNYHHASTHSSSRSNLPPNCYRVYVGGLHVNLTEEMLRSLFEPFGPILRLELMRDRTTNVSRGYAFITYVNMEDGQEAVRCLDGFELAGKPMRVSKSTDKSERHTGTDSINAG